MIPPDPDARLAVGVFAIEAENDALSLDQPVPTHDDVTDVETKVDDWATDHHFTLRPRLRNALSV